MSTSEAAAAAPISFGYLPDPEDRRDVDMMDHPGIQAIIGDPRSELHKARRARKLPPKAMVGFAAPPAPPVRLSLRDKCGPVQDQGHLNACTAHAAAAVMNLVQAHLNKRSYAGSRMFLYRVSRSLLHWNGDTGAYLRTAAGSLSLFGLPPEDYWPYDPAQLDTEPPTFCYMLGQQYRASSYFRIDSAGVSPQEVVDRIRDLLRQGFPTMFGYDVYMSAEFQGRANGGIPIPIKSDLKIGGHALAICGYDDERKITNTSTGGTTTTGAFEIQNSRGTGWGDQGFGWMPYEYFLTRVAQDCWSIVNMDWVDLQPYQKDQQPVPPSGPPGPPPATP